MDPRATVGVAVAGAAILALLPRPLDLRSVVYAFFVPIAMTYGALAGELAVLIVGAAAGAAFVFEKTAALKGRESKG